MYQADIFIYMMNYNFFNGIVSYKYKKLKISLNV